MDRPLLEKLNGLMASADYEISISERLPLVCAAVAHRLLEEARAGRPVLIVNA